VKNHFYSKLRKSVRKLNRIILEKYPNKFKPIKTKVLYKIIETTEFRFKPSPEVEEKLVDFCLSILRYNSRYQKHSF
jgi:hypothetical protein